MVIELIWISLKASARGFQTAPGGGRGVRSHFETLEMNDR